MATPPQPPGARVRVEAVQFPQLLTALSSQGYCLVGPSLEDGRFIYGELASARDLPRGWTDEQEAGAFRLKPRSDQAWFGYGVGQHSWKQFLLPPRQTLWQVQREGPGWVIRLAEAEAPRFAFVGVHPCDLSAMAVQDRVFLQGRHLEPTYQARREAAFVLAVNCAGRTCGTGFCVSMGTGPQATSGFDLALTEVLQEGSYFICEVGTARGGALLSEVPWRPATPGELEAAARLVAETARHLGRTLDTAGIKELLYRSYEHPRWDDVAGRCLTCGNCTSVCPTCFCHTLEDSVDLTGTVAERRRRLDVCFTVDYSYLHGGSIRPSPRSRYRQWLTHKLATWIDQFGCSGCVGCGRCITWCPVAIDITAEVRAIRETKEKP